MSIIMVGTVAASAGPVMTEPKLTEAMITGAMAKAETRVGTENPRCYAFSSDVDSARARCTAKGRCRVGWVTRSRGREA